MNPLSAQYLVDKNYTGFCLRERSTRNVIRNFSTQRECYDYARMFGLWLVDN